MDEPYPATRPCRRCCVHLDPVLTRAGYTTHVNCDGAETPWQYMPRPGGPDGNELPAR